KPYRADKELRLAGGGYPRGLDYLDHIAFAKLKDATGQPAKLVPGNVIEYWLEAHDNCDYPHPNVAESTHFRVKLTEPDKDEKKQQQEQQQADQDQQQHNQDQDKNLKDENKAQQDDNKRQEEENKKQEQKPQENKGDPNDKK